MLHKKFRFKFEIIFLGLCLLNPTIAHALTSDEENTLNQLNKKLQRNNERIFEEEERKMQQKNLSKPAPQIEIVPEKEPKIKPKEKCFLINKIILSDSKSLLKKERKNLVKEFQGKCLSLSDIDRLRIKINNFYIEKGYIMSRAYLVPNQNIKNGTLEFEIKEGEIEKITINGNKTLSDRIRLLTAFPYAQDQSLNLRDIEQGLDQINRLRSSSATVKIIPGTIEGKSIVQITNKEDWTTHGSVSYDNNGQKSTGERRRVITLEQDNLLKLNDSFYINYSHDQEGQSEIKHSQNIYANLSIPYGYWLYSFSVTDSNYLSTLPLTYNSLQYSGNSRSYIADVSRVVQRGKITNTSVSGTLKTINTEAFADGSKLDNSSRKLTILDLNLRHKLRLESSMITFDLAYSRGLTSFGALQDQANLPDNYPKAQFEMLKLNAMLYKRFDVAAQEISYRGNLSGQLSKDSLYSSEQMSIGDPFSVRGFKNNSIASDNGGYIRNELSIRMPKITDKYYINRALQGLNFFVGYDTGFVKSRSQSDASLNGKDRAYLSGWSTGIKNYGKYLDYGLTYSKAINAPHFVKTENREIYFYVTLSI